MAINKKEDIYSNAINNPVTDTLGGLPSWTDPVFDYLKKPLFHGILIVLFFASTFTAVYFYFQYDKASADPQKIAQSKQATLIAQVSRLILLPQGENPTIATVSNIDVLRNQPFFANAKNGDSVLIYVKARKAILYDETNNKIIEVAPINIGNPPAESAKTK